MARIPKPAATAELAAVEGRVLTCLRTRDFDGAVRALAAYEAAQPRPRGIGVDWSRADRLVPGLSAGLTAIYSADTREEIREGAAMTYLWGTGRPRRRWLAADLHADALAQRLVLDAYAAQQAEYDRRAASMGIFIRRRSSVVGI